MKKNDLPQEKALFYFESRVETTIVPEPGALLSLPSLAIYDKIEKILVVCGSSSSYKSGFRKKFDLLMDDIDCNIHFYEEIEPEPDVQNVEKLKNFIDVFSPDMIVAVGGGSVMDAAKAAYLWNQGGGNFESYFGLNKYSSGNPGKKLKKVVCVPTTAGTGSEVTPYAAIVDSHIGVKKIISEKEIIPSHALIDSSLCMSCGKDLTLHTALDALCHSIEGYLQPNTTKQDDECDEWAIEAIEMISENLPKVLRNPKDATARTNLSYAATLAGLVISHKPTGIPHLLSFPFFGKIAHGLAVALILPASWTYYCENRNVAEKTMRLKGIFGGDAPNEVISGYKNFLKNCGAPSGISNFLTDAELESSVMLASENKLKLELLPRKIAVDNVKETLCEIIFAAK